MAGKPKVSKPNKATPKVVTALAPVSIYTALFAFQAEKIIIPRNGRGKTPQGREYKYATLDDVINITRDPLQAHGLMYTQTIFQDDKGDTFLKTTLIAVNATEGQLNMLETSIPLGKPGSAQDMGSRITYMRRYALVPMLGLSIEEDTDAVPPEITIVQAKKEDLNNAPVEIKQNPNMEENVPVVSELKETPGAELPPLPEKQFVYTTETAKAKLQPVVDAIQNAAKRSVPHEKAYNAVQSCENEEALALMTDRVKNSILLNEAEKRNMLEVVIPLKETQLSGTVHI